MYIQNIVLIVITLLLMSCGTVFDKNFRSENDLNNQLNKIYTENDFFVNERSCYEEKNFNEAYIYNLNLLFDEISKGDTYSFDIGLLILHCMDGGALGDIYRSFGTFFEINPEYFIKAINENKILDVRLKKIFTALPLLTVDNLMLKIEILQLRINLLLNYKNIMNNDKYDRALLFLKNNLMFNENLVIKEITKDSHHSEY